LLKALAPIASAKDELELLSLARETTRRRVVVKRPLTAPPIGNAKPQVEFVGKAVRYDVYLKPGV
jgi:16S rRNA (guanine1516-N2)-methyltransferase